MRSVKRGHRVHGVSHITIIEVSGRVLAASSTPKWREPTLWGKITLRKHLCAVVLSARALVTTASREKGDADQLEILDGSATFVGPGQSVEHPERSLTEPA